LGFSIVHKAGFADDDYMNGIGSFPLLAKAELNKLLALNGELVLELTVPVMVKSVELMRAVDVWLESH